VQYVDKLSRTAAGIVLKYVPDGGDHTALENLLAGGLLEGTIEKDLIDEMSDLRKQLGSLEEKLAKMVAQQEAEKINAHVAEGAAEKAAIEAAAAAVEAEVEAEKAAIQKASADAAAAGSPVSKEPTEMAKLQAKLASLERSFSEEVQQNDGAFHTEFQVFKDITNTALTELEAEMKNGGGGVKRQRKKEESRGVGGIEDSASGVEEDDDFDVLEKNLRHEIESVLQKLQELDKRVESRFSEDEDEFTDGPEGVHVCICIYTCKHKHV